MTRQPKNKRAGDGQAGVNLKSSRPAGKNRPVKPFSRSEQQGPRGRCALKPAAIRVAAYVRTATVHPQCSAKKQKDMIRRYAARHGMKIVRTYFDEGRSGLSIQYRDQFKQMMADVQGGNADFTCILLHDVSRWGRFQDADEGAHYEFICRRAGISVHYCAKPFESPILKRIKRAVAAAYKHKSAA